MNAAPRRGGGPPGFVEKRRVVERTHAEHNDVLACTDRRQNTTRRALYRGGFQQDRKILLQQFVKAVTGPGAGALGIGLHARSLGVITGHDIQHAPGVGSHDAGDIATAQNPDLHCSV